MSGRKKKVCSKCKAEKPASEFGTRRDRKSGLTSQCRSCMNSWKRTHRKGHAYNQYSAYQAAWRQWRSSEIKKKLVDEHGGKCKRCGGKFHQVAFDFDHLSEKEAEVGALISAGKEDEAREEASKCQLLCSNCHRVLTWERSANRNCKDDSDLLNRGDLIEVLWHDATEDSVGNPDNAYCAIRKTYGLFLGFRDTGQHGALVLSTTQDEDGIDQSGWSAYPMGIIGSIKLIRRAGKADRRRKH